MVNWTATVLAREVRSGDRSARDNVAGALEHTHRDQDSLNTATFIDDSAVERGELIDEMIESGADPGPLAGVPVALKDLIDRQGHVTTCGSSFYRQTAERSATVVERLEAAGAVIVSRTGLHEFAYGFSSENHWFGPVRNPVDPTTSPGGSSGGSAAAVAAGQTPVAIGTDTGGSVRVPAAMCGILGLKVTHGRVPLTGVFPLATSLDTVGPLATTVADLAAVYSAIAGSDPADPWSRSHPVVTARGERPDLRGIRVGVPVPWVDDAPVTDEVAEGFAGAMASIQALGAEVVELSAPDLNPPGKIMEISAGEAASVHRTWLAEGCEYGPEVAARLEAALAVTLDQYVEAQSWRAGLQKATSAAFRAVDLIATPATGATRKVIGEDAIATPMGDLHYRTVLSCFSALVNHMGCPALVGPIGGAGGTPPPALQLIAPWWAEHRLFEVGSTLEKANVMTAQVP